VLQEVVVITVKVLAAQRLRNKSRGGGKCVTFRLFRSLDLAFQRCVFDVKPFSFASEDEVHNSQHHERAK
jgi:hypothetical protein